MAERFGGYHVIWRLETSSIRPPLEPELKKMKFNSPKNTASTNASGQQAG